MLIQWLWRSLRQAMKARGAMSAGGGFCLNTAAVLEFGTRKISHTVITMDGLIRSLWLGLMLCMADGYLLSDSYNLSCNAFPIKPGHPRSSSLKATAPCAESTGFLTCLLDSGAVGINHYEPHATNSHLLSCCFREWNFKVQVLAEPGSLLLQLLLACDRCITTCCHLHTFFFLAPVCPLFFNEIMTTWI